MDRKTGFHTRSILAVPVLNKLGIPIGVMQVLNRRGGPFRLRDQRRLEMLAAQSAIALDNARLFREVLDERNYSENVLRSLSDGVITLDTSHNIVKMNEAASAILRIRPEEVLGASAQRIFANGNTWVLESIRKVIANCEPDMILDADLHTFDDCDVAVNVNTTPLADPEGHMLGCTMIIEDITEDKRVRATLARYMNAEVAEQVLAEGESVLGGRSQNSTILFSDIKGFTTITESFGAPDTVSMLNEYFTEMEGVIFDHNGILDKCIGDAIMAVFGAPFPSPEDADNAVKVAIRMQQVLSALNRRRREADRPEFEIRIGINSADVVAGNIGSARRMDYTVIGDGVNIAARLESANKQFGTRVLISESTRELLQEDYRLRELDLIRVRGRLEPLSVLEVRGLASELVSSSESDLLDYFAHGLASYRGRLWTDAIGRFEKALECDAQDCPSALFRRRAMHYRDHEPAYNWDGVWTLTEK